MPYPDKNTRQLRLFKVFKHLTLQDNDLNNGLLRSKQKKIISFTLKVLGEENAVAEDGYLPIIITKKQDKILSKLIKNSKFLNSASFISQGNNVYNIFQALRRSKAIRFLSTKLESTNEKIINYFSRYLQRNYSLLKLEFKITKSFNMNQFGNILSKHKKPLSLKLIASDTFFISEGLLNHLTKENSVKLNSLSLMGSHFNCNASYLDKLELRVLELTNTGRCIPEGLLTWLSTTTFLKVFKLRGTFPVTAYNTATYLKDNNSLESIEISHYISPPANAQIHSIVSNMSELIKNNTSLKKLSLDLDAGDALDEEDTSKGIGLLLQTLKEQPLSSLMLLDLRQVGDTPSSFHLKLLCGILLDPNSKLTSVSLPNYKIDDECTDQLAKVFEKNDKLKSIKFGAAKDSSINIDTWKLFATALANNKTLRTLAYRNIGKINHEFLLTLLERLKDNNTLQELDVITYGGSSILCDPLGFQHKILKAISNSNLVNVHLRTNTDDVDFNKKLKSINNDRQIIATGYMKGRFFQRPKNAVEYTATTDLQHSSQNSC